MKKLAILALALSAAACTSLNIGGGLKDGTYKANMAADSRGWTPKMTMEVKGGKIAKVDFDNFNKDGLTKRDPKSGYSNEAWKEKSGEDSITATPKLIDKMIATGNAPVEIVAGATSLSNQFISMGQQLVMNAKKGDTKDTFVTGLRDGIYKANMAADSRGWTPKMTMEVKGGKIVKVDFDNFNKDGLTKRDPKSGYSNEAWKAKGGEDSITATPKLIANMIAKGNAPVDSVAGATSLSTQFNEMGKALIKNAQSGKMVDTLVAMPEAKPATTTPAAK